MNIIEETLPLSLLPFPPLLSPSLSCSSSRLPFTAMSRLLRPRFLLSRSLTRRELPHILRHPTLLPASRYPVLTGQRAVLSTFSPRFKELKREEIPTFANQASIPRLPIPRLEDTAKRYLRSLEPLLGPEEFKRSQSAVEAFIAPGGLGEKLQERLFKLDEKAPHSWLEDIWLSKAYLEWREPSYINVNWWTRLRDPPYGLSLPPPKHVTVYQRRRAARLIASLLDTNDRINT